MNDEEIIKLLKDSNLRCVFAIIYNTICRSIAMNGLSIPGTVVSSMGISEYYIKTGRTLYRSFTYSPHCVVVNGKLSDTEMKHTWDELWNKTKEFSSILERLFKPLDISFVLEQNKKVPIINIVFRINDCPPKVSQGIFKVLAALESTLIYKSLIYQTKETSESPQDEPEEW